jgi:competence protein ComGC
MSSEDSRLKVVEGFTIVNFVLLLVVIALLLAFMFRVKKESAAVSSNLTGFAQRLKSIGGAVGSAFANYYLE